MSTASPGTSTPTETAKGRIGLESLGLLLLSLATVGTAWCSYQATTWGAAAQRVMNQSMAASRLAATVQLRSSQMALLDVLLFSQYVNAHTGSNEPLAQSITVLPASALFCGGTASKFDILPIRRAVLVLGLAAFAFAIVKLVSLPVKL